MSFTTYTDNINKCASANLQQNGCYNEVADLSSSDRAKKAAAFASAEIEVKDGMNIGVGSGTTVKFLIDWLKYKRQAGQFQNIRCVPTSFQTRRWLNDACIPVYDLNEIYDLDLTIDGADEVDSKLNCIKGGGGCLLQEKIVQTCAKRFILIGGIDKYSHVFGNVAQSIPIEISPLSYEPIQRWIVKKYGGECVLRMDARKCFPVITENHNYLIDWNFPKPISQNFDWNNLNQNLLCTPGIFETGLFVGVADVAYFATPEGDVQRIETKT